MSKLLKQNWLKKSLKIFHSNYHISGCDNRTQKRKLSSDSLEFYLLVARRAAQIQDKILLQSRVRVALDDYKDAGHVRARGNSRLFCFL